ncbi:hypothetical protein E6_50 [Propionibacterium phage E6]|uniref:Uncharacterized protein n=1 Tax=Propionibacterium phage E6 TaxID=1897536 RepID=A0A1D8EU45_9CAUD|nr:replication initiation protein [Propionibacterium phage E6]AOT24579.1 hypothetical protein E6_50 [Propionibacterium phage E6]
MAWFKVDDQFWSHPKVIRCSDKAIALWVRAGSWSSQQLTNGEVPVEALAMFKANRQTAEELVGTGLWKRNGTGFQFHDWSTYQPAGSEVEELRIKRAEAGRRGGKKSAQTRWGDRREQANG